VLRVVRYVLDVLVSLQILGFSVCVLFVMCWMFMNPANFRV
jgi:hypothetical protein